MSTSRQQLFTAAALASACLALTACGDSGTRPPGGATAKRTPAALRDCLAARPGLENVTLAGTGRASTTTTRPRGTDRIARAAIAGVIFGTGGPRQTGQTIVEAPVQLNELYVLRSPAVASREAAVARPAVARAQTAQISAHGPAPPSSAEAIGAAVLVHRAGAFGPALGPPVSEFERGAARDCLRKAGYG